MSAPALAVLIDMNLSIAWVEALASVGLQAVHWSAVGEARAPDSEIIEWASVHRHIVLTNDLDFGSILALSHASGPSVISIRGVDVLPHSLLTALIGVIRRHEAALADGALIVVDIAKDRVRLLPL